MLLIATYFSVFILYVLNFFDDVFLTPLRKYSYFIVLFFAFLLLGFTQNTIDYEGYRAYYDTVKTLTNYNSDILFNVGILIFKFFCFPFEFFYHFVGILNFILLVFIADLYFSKSREKILFIICYLSFTFLLKDLIQMRNALALKWFLLSVYLQFRNKKIAGFLFYLISVLTHNSLIMFLPLFFVYKRFKFSLLTLLLVYFAFFFVYFGNGFVKILKSLMIFGGRLGAYLDLASRDFDALSLFHLLRLCVYLGFFYIFIRNEDNLLLRFAFFCVVYGYLIRVCFIDVSLISSRLAENTYLFETILLSKILSKNCGKILYLIKYAFVFLYCAIYINMIFGNLDFLNVYKNLIL